MPEVKLGPTSQLFLRLRIRSQLLNSLGLFLKLRHFVNHSLPLLLLGFRLRDNLAILFRFRVICRGFD